MRPIDQRLQEARKAERWTQVYRDAPETFRAFEAAEDPGGLAARRMVQLAKLQGKRVLEIGSGTGWLTRYVDEVAARHVAVEPEAAMIASAMDLGDAKVLRARGESLPFAPGSFDAAVMSWVLLDLRPELRTKVLRQCDRVLGSGLLSSPSTEQLGTWVIENAGTGEFQELRGIEDPGGLGEVAPLVHDCGFELVEVVETEMRFPNAATAEATLGAILGDQVRRKLQAQPRSSLSLDLAILFRPMGQG
ncbi:MAG: class I SAM-dependent methyltransferase [Planctomycetota bacterium]|nr:class I SAM-dependent methyltransferase [Planctomycetota bacterium]